VRFLGLQDDAQLAQLYATCECVVLPSLREGFDIPVVEALRANAPLALSRIPVHTELAPTAASFDPQYARSCAEAIHAAQRATFTPPRLATWDHCAAAMSAAFEAVR
jgi:glycosyltransferase involved in cell wall biosynthesis